MIGLMTSLSTMMKTGWTGLEHGVMVLTMTGHSWTGMMTQTGATGWTDNWTWSTGSDSTGTSALSQPQQPGASSSTPRAQLVSLVCSQAKLHPHQTCQHFTQL